MADIIIIAAVALGIFFGYMNGFMKALVSLASSVFSIAIGFLLYDRVYEILRATVIYEWICSAVESRLSSASPSAIVNGILSQNIQTISGGILTIICFFVIIMFVKVTFFVIEHAVGLIKKLGPIDFFDKTLGAALGAVISLAIIWAAVNAAAMLAAHGVSAPLDAVKEGQISSLFYNFDLFGTIKKLEGGILNVR